MRTLPFEFGRYTLFDHIGRGGMADIYLARTRTELAGARLVVVKEVIPELASNERFVTMLIREAKLAAGLHHANIARVEDLGEHDGAPFVAMEYLEGIDLSQLLRLCSKRKLSFEMRDRLRIVVAVLKALDHAHRFRNEAGELTPIVHRDVSPSNVLLSFDGEVKLCDFGIACALQSDQLDSETIEGKAGYMSPEQARGEVVDGRSDVFVCGIMLWELLHGRRMYRSKEEPLLALAQRGEIPVAKAPPLPGYEEILAVAKKALRREPNERYATAAEMAEDLQGYLVKAKLLTSAIRFGGWLTEHFAEEQRERRRARQRVLQALEQGPAAVLEAIEAPVLPAEDEGDAQENEQSDRDPEQDRHEQPATPSAPTEQEASAAGEPRERRSDSVAPAPPQQRHLQGQSHAKWGVGAFVATLIVYYLLSQLGVL